MVTQNMAADLAPQVRVNAISVGGVDTQAMSFVMNNPGLREQYVSNTPMGRIGQPRDIAAAALYLASPASSWVTGVILRVDGGTTSPSFQIPVDPIKPTGGD
jgi:7-alpha-hydroxysteroid dehydrogenase